MGSAVATPMEAGGPGAATKQQRVQFDAGATSALETWIDQMDQELPQLTNFILPSGTMVMCSRWPTSIPAMPVSTAWQITWITARCKSCRRSCVVIFAHGPVNMQTSRASSCAASATGICEYQRRHLHEPLERLPLYSGTLGGGCYVMDMVMQVTNRDRSQCCMLRHAAPTLVGRVQAKRGGQGGGHLQEGVTPALLLAASAAIDF